MNESVWILTVYGVMKKKTSVSECDNGSHVTAPY